MRREGTGAETGWAATPHAQPLRHAGLVWSMAALLFVYGAFGKDLFYNPFREGVLVDPYAALQTAARVATGVAALTVAQFVRRIRIGGFVTILLYAVLAFCTAAWSLNPVQTVRSAVIFASFVLATVSIAPVLGQRTGLAILLHLLALVVIASAALALVVPSIGQHAATDALQAVHAGRWRGIFIHKNHLGAYAAYAVILLFGFSHGAGGPRLYWLAAKCAAVACLVMAGSATAVAAAAVMSGAYLYLRGASGRRLSAIFAHLLLIVPALLAAGSLVSLIVELTGRDLSLTGRTEIWDVAIDAWLEQPWFGYGFGTANVTVLKDRLMAELFSAAVDAHSGYLETLLDSGVIGLALLVAAILQSFGICLRRAYAADAGTRAPALAFGVVLIGACVMAVAEVNPFRVFGYTGFITYFALVFARVAPSAAAMPVKLPVRRTRPRSFGSPRHGNGPARAGLHPRSDPA